MEDFNMTTPTMMSEDEHNHHLVDKIEEYLYSDGHGYFSLATCALGIGMNVLTLLVLTKKSMRTPTNLLLGSISVADLITIAMYIPKMFVLTVTPQFDKTKEFVHYKLVSLAIFI